MTTTLAVQGLGKSYGALRAVHDLSFEVAGGETFGLLGPNGAGKTTTISMVCGLLAPDTGRVVVDGVEIRPGSVAGRELIGYVPQELALYPDLSGRDNLRFFARLYGLKGATAAERIDETLTTVGLLDRGDDRVTTYSGGMKRRLNIAAGLLHRPRLLILDEPTVGIDPQSRNAILEAVAELGQTGMSVVYTTHYMEEAERLCDRVGIVDHGELRAVGTRRELTALVGEHDVITLRLLGSADAAARLASGVPGVVEASARGEQDVECVADGAAAVLPRLLTALHEAGLAAQEIAVREPSLDSVFLHLTGTALRD